jgi:hypothetical protein
MEFKISPLILFIILLVVLALSAMIKNYMGTEGFITYNYDNKMFTNQTVGIYSTDNPITKIYDDIYYDPRNGNIVVIYTKNVFGIDGAQADTDGKNIKAINIVPRKNETTSQISEYSNASIDKKDDKGVSLAVAVTQVTPESRKATLDAVDVAWSFKSGSNQVNYFTWGTNTYIYVMDITGISVAGNSSSPGYDKARFKDSYSENGAAYSGAIKHASAAYYTGSINPGITLDFTGADGDEFDDIIVESTYPQQTNSGYEDKSSIEPIYDKSRQIYNITSHIKYDIANGNLVIITSTLANKGADVYYRSGADKREDARPDTQLVGLASERISSGDSPIYITQSFSKSVSKPFFVQDTINKNTVMYWPTGENTLIAVFENRKTPNEYVPIKKTVRFTSSGVWTPPKEEEKKDEKNTDNSGNTDISGGNYGDFWKWWSYFNSNAVGGLSNDYMLKTQIVPPVCPSCPACQGGACTNCGGAGGSGSMAADGSSLAIKGPSSAAASLGQSASSAVQGTAAVAGLTAIGTGALATNLAGKTLDTAGNIVNKTVDTAGNIVNRTFDAAGNIVDKTFDAAGNVVNTTGGLLQSAGSGLTNLFTSDPRRVGYEQSYTGPRPGSNYTGIYNPLPKQQGQASGPNIDPYTYNGALQSKGSNFRPVTTDFSSFGL